MNVSNLDLDKLAVSELNAFNSQLRDISKSSSDQLQLLLSHAPVLPSYGQPARLAGELEADLILSAHDHTAQIYRKRRALDGSHVSVERLPYSQGDPPFTARITRRDQVVEIQSPSCSYRMGVPIMGYGLLTLRKRLGEGGTAELEARYTVMWLPGRYPQLYLYLAVVIVLICVIVRCFICNVFKTEKVFKHNVV